MPGSGDQGASNRRAAKVDPSKRSGIISGDVSPQAEICRTDVLSLFFTSAKNRASGPALGSELAVLFCQSGELPASTITQS
jgi:hypothetical protein